MKIGLQLFTLINIMKTEDGLRKAIKHAAEAGYDGVEFAGFHGLTAAEVKTELDKYGLEAAGLHLGWDNMNLENLEKDPEDVVCTAKALGLHSVTVASYSGQTRAEWEDFAKRINKYGKLFRENGIALGYHNHRHEFKKFDDEYIIDIFLNNCAPENVFWEIDPRHIVVAGEDPVAFATKYKDRVPFFHMRDIEKIIGADTAQDCAVGDGIVDIAGAVQASGKHEWLIVEEGPLDSDAEMLTHIKKSVDYIRANF